MRAGLVKPRLLNYRFVRRLLISDGAFEQRAILLCSGDELAS